MAFFNLCSRDGPVPPDRLADDSMQCTEVSDWQCKQVVMAWQCCGSAPTLRKRHVQQEHKAAAACHPSSQPQLEPEPEPRMPGPMPQLESEIQQRSARRHSSTRLANRRERAEATAIREVKEQRRIRRQREQAAAAAAAAAATTAPVAEEPEAFSLDHDLPDGWVDFPAHCLTTLTVAVPLDEPEAVSVRTPFDEVGLRVVEVLRVQNRPLWRRFIGERELLAQVHGAGWQPNERRLYHATSDDALMLAEGPGLDERFSSGGGNLGRAIYCASNPRKAHQYAHGRAVNRVRELTRRQVLVVNAILGDCLRLPRGETRCDWVKEPPKPPALVRRGSCGEYDSVSGFPQPPTYYEEYAFFNRYRLYAEYVVVYEDVLTIPSEEAIATFMSEIQLDQNRTAATTRDHKQAPLFKESAIDWLVHSKLDVRAAVENFNAHLDK